MATTPKPTSRATRSATAAPSQATPDSPQTSPSLGSSQGDVTLFVWQRLGEIQSSLADMKKDIGQLQQASVEQRDTATRSADKMEVAIEKLVAKTDDLTGEIHSIKTRLAIAAAVGALVLVVAGWIFKEVWDVAKPLLVQRLTAEQPAAAKPASKP